jgi:hypothetical protein
MALEHVANLVAKHSRELRFVLKAIEQRAGDEDRTTGKGKGIHRLRVAKEMKAVLIGRFRTWPTLHEFISDGLDKGLRVFIRVEAAELLRHLRRGLQTHRNFLVCGQGNVLFFSRDWIDRAFSELPDDTHQ